MPAYQILLEEHIIRKNAGLPTEHPDHYSDRMEQERLAELHSNAEKSDKSPDHDDDEQE